PRAWPPPAGPSQRPVRPSASSRAPSTRTRTQWRRRPMRRLMAGTILGTGMVLAAWSAHAQETVRFWYHFDNPDNPMDALIADFEAAHPDIRIEAENVPWNSYYDNLYTAIVGGNAPDAAMVKLFAQPRLLEMGALEPLDEIGRAHV